MNDQSWVTLAGTDTNAWEALVLAKSLRRIFATRKLTVVITQHVSQPMKVFLQEEFDLVVGFHTSELQLGDGTTNPQLANLWAWNLKAWGKCVFLTSNSLVLENSDQLFKMNEISACRGRKFGQFSTDLFVFQPRSETFKKLMGVCATEGTLEAVLNQHFTTWRTSPRNHIESALKGTVEEIELGTRPGIPSIVRFLGVPWELKSGSRDAKVFGEKWLETFVHEVLPSLSDVKNESLEGFLMGSIAENNLPSQGGPHKSLPEVNLGDLQEAIAVVGMSCRFPGANSPAQYWDLLASGTDPVRPFPTTRPRLHGEVPSPSYQAGFLSCRVDEFDAKFFGISPREAPFVDPQQRILLEVIWESLENANISPLGLKGTETGVFLGLWEQDYVQLIPDTGLHPNDFHHKYLGNSFSATASRISYFLGLLGPNISIESGCSSSSGAVHLACNSLRRGETSLAVASGVNLVLRELSRLTGDSKDSVLMSQAYRCKTFDESADGFVRAEGVGAIVLKRYADARRDGDKVLALIRGSALNNNGAGTSFGTPNPEAQERVFRAALSNANVLGSEVSYVEAHGTGTKVGGTGVGLEAYLNGPKLRPTLSPITALFLTISNKTILIPSIIVK